MLGPGPMKNPRKVETVDTPTRPCPCCGQPVAGLRPHSAREKFEHFLAYSGWAGEDQALKDKLWKAWQHAHSPDLVEELVIEFQGQPGEGPPTAVDFRDPNRAPVDLGPWEAMEFDRWRVRVPLRPLVRTYAPQKLEPPAGE